MNPNPEKLTCVSMMICDSIYRDEQTKKLILVGTFNAITTRTLPCRHPRMSVIFTLTNGRGKYHLRLSIEHERSGHEVATLQGPLIVDDPLEVTDVNVELLDIEFTEEGKYWVVLSADGDILQQRPLWVKQASGSPTPEASESRHA